MDSQDSAPRLSDDPSAELATLIARELKLHEEGLALTRRIGELHRQISQRTDDSAEASAAEPAKSDR